MLILKNWITVNSIKHSYRYSSFKVNAVRRYNLKKSIHNKRVGLMTGNLM